MNAMDANIKEKWLKALRSGEYGQWRNALLDTTGDTSNAFCCIGVGYVACKGPIDFGDETYRAAEALGLDSDMADRLAGMNDIQKKSFKQIANWIEAHIPADPALIGNERP